MIKNFLPGIHVGIIPDGNRRYCKKNNTTLTKLLNKWTKEKLENFLDEINKNELEKKFKEIDTISFYMMSKDNLTKRGGCDVEVIFKALDYFVNLYTDAINDKSHKYHNNLIQVRIKVIGDLKLLSRETREKIKLLEKPSKKFIKNKKLLIRIAFAYDPIKDTKNIINNKRKTRMIDLVIRTSGEKRLSGFFPIESMYSEFMFLDKLWPEFEIADLENCMIDFSKRNRRFGK